MGWKSKPEDLVYFGRVLNLQKEDNKIFYRDAIIKINKCKPLIRMSNEY